tara:strand:- start:330 stop:596 length:267 start_codon:yes stop_codon:yes gene_type:complete
MTDFILVFEHRIAGIPCQIGVLNYMYVPPFSKDPHRCETPDEYYGYSEVDYTILDRKGRPAAWLQRKITDDSEIISEIHERISTNEDH